METKIRVLILEDNVSDAELMKRELQKSGLDFRAELAQDRRSFHAALDKLAPDIILADYSLPEFDGLSAVTIARERFPQTPVIIVSGAIGEETAIEALKAGATDYVLKNRLKRLASVVDRALNEAAAAAQARKTENLLKQSQELIIKIAEAIPNIVYVFDIREDRIVYANKELKNILGYTKEDIQRMGPALYQKIVHPGDLSAVNKMRRNLLKMKDSGPDEIAIRIKDAGGQWRFISNKFVIFMRTEDGYPKQLLGFAQDITERKQAEDALRRDKETVDKLVRERTVQLVEAQMELEKARRLSDIGVLAATVAHELRNPLAAIQMAAHNIERKAKNTADIDKHLANIGKKVAESDQIINNLLFYSRLKSPHYESIDISHIIEECAEGLKRSGKKEPAVTQETDPIKDIMIEADPVQTKEVFNNILNNAYDAVPAEKGRIGIIAENEYEFVKVAIEDNGTGIEKDTLDKIFDPFFTTKAKGTGLGLSVCRQIINMHGGEIWVKSEPGQGTSVFVRLPKKRKDKRPPVRIS